MRVTGTLFSVTLKFLCQTGTQMFIVMPTGAFGAVRRVRGKTLCIE